MEGEKDLQARISSHHQILHLLEDPQDLEKKDQLVREVCLEGIVVIQRIQRLDFFIDGSLLN